MPAKKKAALPGRRIKQKACITTRVKEKPLA
jgi:hypothetical protein